MCPFLYPAPEESADRDGWSPAAWEPYAWKPEARGRPPRPRGAAVASFARRLMAIERARAQRHKLADVLVRVQKRRRPGLRGER